MHSTSGTSMRPKKMVSLVECFTYPISGKMSQIRITKSKSEKRNEKTNFTSLSLLIQQALFELKSTLKVPAKIVFN